MWIPAGARRLRRALPVAAALPSFVLLACASAGGERSATGAAPAGAVSFAIENTESPGQGLSVTLVSASGDRTLLGAVGPRRSETFVEEGLSKEVSYHLVAGLTAGRDVTSERFTLDPGSTVRWRLPENTLTVSR